MKLRIQFAADVVMIDGQSEVAGPAVGIGAVLPHARGRVSFQFLESFSNGFLVGFDQPFVTPEDGHNRNRLRRRDGEIVEMPCVGLFRPVGTKPVGTLTLPKELAGLGIEPCRRASKSSDFTSPVRPKSSAPRPCQCPTTRSPSA